LIVEDSEDDALLVAEDLRAGGYDVDWARVESPEAMSVALDAAPWDVILSDYNLPRFTGVEALRLLADRGIDVPFILVSGAIGEDVAVAAMKAGAHDYIMKGNPARLLPAVERELREAEVRRTRKRAETALRDSEIRFRSLFDQAAVGIAQSDLDGRWLLINDRLCTIYGYTREELLHRRFQEISLPEDLEEEIPQYGRLLAGEIPSYRVEKRFVRKDGSTRWGDVTVSLVRDQAGIPRYTTAVVVDITERKRMEEALRHQALHDPLTDLPNRVLLLDRLEHAISMCERAGKSVSLLLLDLNHFKEINDTFGHHHGDLLLQQIGKRLRGLLRRSDTVARIQLDKGASVARLGGDEFAVVLPEANVAAAEQIARRITSELARPFTIAGEPLDLEAAIGIAVYPQHGSTSELLLQHADVAMYAAKRDQSGMAAYEAALDPYAAGRLARIRDLHYAVEHDGLDLYYQPKVDLATGRIVGAEALVRWNHAEDGFIPPPHIIELAEHTGLIRPLTDWVLVSATRQCRTWRDAGLALTVSVNASPRSLQSLQFVDTVRLALECEHLPPSALVIEVTEGAVMEDPERVAEVLNRLSALGVAISIDDFGTGYSSLSYLKRLAPDELKIDRSFVTDLDTDDESRFIVRAAVGLAHDLGLVTVAEGIESQRVLDLLASLGCDRAQGYHLGRPMPAKDFADWLTERSIGGKSA
jgi:diguanylate cyclase (GGDEF)-like protein/PAS domain S-box-containing protein